ncbi:MAG: sulfatase-like hydrolase/transferase [Rhodospirillaceae bacterium]|nr:sulfatase-like hydrolase/transferase [Rhodospirillaceae bacterium]
MHDTERRRPNILFITSDQQRGDCYGFEGRRIRTPHLDRLAAEGTRFAACITPNVVCQPSRASILTGLLPMTHGVHDNGISLDPETGEAGFAGALAAAGYRTGFVGKAHFATYSTFAPTGSPECIESSKDFGPDWTGPYMGFGHVDLMLVGHNWFPVRKPPQGLHYERWYHADGRGDAKTDLYWGDFRETGGLAAQTWNSKLPEAWHNSAWVGDRTIDFIRADSGADSGAPWCVWASFPDPHHPFDAPEPWCTLHHPDEVDLPEHRTRDFDRRPWWHRETIEKTIEGEFAALRTQYSRIPPQTDRQLRHLIANYYGQISLIDHHVGRILIALADSGQAENTVVVYSSDHGDWLGDHGLILKGPMHYEGLLRVGLIVRGPGIPAGGVVGDPVSTLDLPASFLDWAGADWTDASGPGSRHSTSLRPLIENGARNGGPNGSGRDYAFNEWELHPNRAGVRLSLRCVRTKSHKLTYEALSDTGELYDLANDPQEMDNRWNDPGAAKVQRELMDMIRARPDDAITELNEPDGAA